MKLVRRPSVMSVVIDKLIKLFTDCYFKLSEIPISISESEIIDICEIVKRIFEKEDQLIFTEGPINVCGDIHGQFFDLMTIFKHLGCPQHQKYIFLGDYVDRGSFGVEVIMLLFAYKIKYPQNIFILRGNHECADVCRNYGFYDECLIKFPTYGRFIFKLITDVFRFMPIAGVINNSIFCVHGGISERIMNINEINMIPKGLSTRSHGQLVDLLWSDPMDSPKIRCLHNTNRDIGVFFGSALVDEFLASNNLAMICRAHECVDGHRFDSGKRVVTIFSASKYCGNYDNDGCVMGCDENSKLSFVHFKKVDMQI